MRMSSVHRAADCTTPEKTTQVVEEHYGLETLGTHMGCSISGSYRYETQPNPRAIYQTYVFRSRALLFIQVLQMPIPETEGRNPLDIKERLAHIARRAVIDRIGTGRFKVGEQYEELLPNERESTSSEPRTRGAANEDLFRENRDSNPKKKSHEKPDAAYTTS